MSSPTKVRLHLVFDYELFEAPIEKNPILRIYLTSLISTKIKELRVENKGHIVTTLDWDYEGPEAELEERLQQSALNIDVMDCIANQKGQQSVNQAGCARVFLATLFGKDSKENEYVPGFLPPMPEEKDDKAKFLFYCRKSSVSVISTPFMGTDRPRASASARVNPSTWTTPEWDFNPFSGYISTCRDSVRESHFPPTYEANAHIGMFEYVSRVGRLPVTAFIDAPLPAETTHAYYKNVLGLVLEERNMTKEDYFALDLSKKKDARLASWIVADVISAYACNGTYLLDEMVARDGTKTPVEWFYHLRLRVTSWAEATADCEDDANEIACVEAQEIKSLKRGVCSCVDKMQDVLNSFICTMTLCGVSNAEINLSDVKKAPKTMMAHMGAAMVPKWLFYKWHVSSIPDAVSDSAQVLEQSKAYDVVILEGTGFLRPEGVPKPSRFFDQEESLRIELGKKARGTFGKLRHRYTYDSGGNKKILFSDDAHQSDFYKTVLFLATNEFSRKGWRVTLFAVSPSKAEPSVGVSFQDFAAGNEQIVLFPQPELSKEDDEKMKRMMMDLPPIPPLDAPSDASREWALGKREIMIALEEALEVRAKRNRERNNYKGGETANVEMFVQYSQITDEFASDVLRAVVDANTHDWIFVGFEMQDRQLTDKMGSYRIVFKYA